MYATNMPTTTRIVTHNTMPYLFLIRLINFITGIATMFARKNGRKLLKTS